MNTDENTDNFLIFFVTTPNKELAEKLGYQLVENRIAACANIIEKITSIYQWKGKIEKDNECLMIIKTKSEKANDLILFIEKNHTYDVPECVSVEVYKGSEQYLNWITNSLEISESKKISNLSKK